ncbi:LysR family transcriptional regulator [Microbacterium sp. C5A9]|uniref:LysR family transcriptional regulator n=1 Tax=Microbacterium sp. C5A9 TaxID=2736663 RepID=UPI001F51AE83|nr:LysR family transcriptional regulator [Microbacterium sp. C5A9]MCI1017358.1 LysR family transcriptional regulator [Microbacterium sp. C5A9]
MDIVDYQCVQAIGRHQSLTAAAHALHITQPALTKRVQRMEARIGAKLFHRRPTGMQLTAAGATMLELSSVILSQVEQLNAVMDARHGGQPRLRVACPFSTAEHVLAPFIAQAPPGVSDLVVMPADSIDKALDSEADLAVSTVMPSAGRQWTIVAEIPIMAQARDLSGWSRSPSQFDLEASKTEVLLIPRTGVGIAVRGQAAHLLPTAVFREVVSGSVAQALAASGQGVALATESVRFGLQTMRACVQDRALSIALYASWDPGHFAVREIRELVDQLAAWMAEDPPFPIVHRS